ncbi:hypothetical protein ACQKTA_09060 [Enterococcus sp. 22-H-5-01]|uniref:hypothetical protein n=1 Tax=Enterococcus sp. 22-H-5-01 TaxID=3418555 RepID=UPI003D0465FB
MTKNYLDLEKMRERVAEQDKKKTEEFHQFLNGLADGENKKQQKLQSLVAKGIEQKQAEAQKARDAEIDRDNARLLGEIEDRYESQGVPSAETKKRHQAYKSMLNNLNL